MYLLLRLLTLWFYDLLLCWQYSQVFFIFSKYISLVYEKKPASQVNISWSGSQRRGPIPILSKHVQRSPPQLQTHRDVSASGDTQRTLLSQYSEIFIPRLCANISLSLHYLHVVNRRYVYKCLQYTKVFLPIDKFLIVRNKLPHYFL